MLSLTSSWRSRIGVEAPFLLWHLGSPHNITAYSLEDNEIWHRHFLGMVFQVLEAVYIYVRFRSDTDLNLMAVPIFLAGVWKYGERIWALRSASDKQLMNSSAQREQASPEENNIIRFRLFESKINDCFERKGNVSELKLLREAYSPFLIFKPLFLGLSVELSAKFYDDMFFINSKSAVEAFKLVGTELKYLYYLFFTKVPLHHNHQKVSSSLRALCFLSAVSSLIAFSTIVDKSVHSKVDIVITYLLLLGAISLDAYSFIMHLLSIWSMIWLPVPKNTVQKMYSKVVASRWQLVEAKMAIKSVAQHDIIYYYVEANAIKLYDAVRIIDTGNHLQKDWHTKWKPVDCELKQFIYDHLKKERGKLDEKDFGPEDLKKLLNAPFFEDLEEDTTDFSLRIIRWHLATELVYYDHLNKFRRGKLGSFCQIAKSLSDYMMYLVLVRLLMLPKGYSEAINNENYRQAKNLFPEDMTTNMRKIEVRKRFTSSVLGRQSSPTKSNRFDLINGGSSFAEKLQSVVAQERWDHEEKWEMISKVWLGMMLYAASLCSWKEHAQQLRHGGELLTHVALLMAHLGLTTQIRKSKSLDYEDELNPAFPPLFR
ncbi:hypothetical protein SCA6_006049 [Theobroma cacao]